jgi:hypothetical protein
MSGYTKGKLAVGKQEDCSVLIDAPNGDATLGSSAWYGIAAVYGCEDDPYVGDKVMLANAARLVKCWNMHDDLIRALSDLLDDTQHKGHECGDSEENCPVLRAIALIRKAGESP